MTNRSTVERRSPIDEVAVPESGEYYAAYGHQSESARFVPEHLLTLLPPDIQVRTALDIGSGTGISTRLIAGRFTGSRVFALEPQMSMQDQARQTDPPQVTHLSGAAEDLGGLDLPSLDLVVCSSSIWHMDRPRLFQEIARRLTAGGRFVFNIGESFIDLPDVVLAPGNRKYLTELLRAGFELGMNLPDPREPGAVQAGPRPKETIDSLTRTINEAGIDVDSRDLVDQSVNLEESRAWMAIPMYTHSLPGLTPEQCRAAAETALSRMPSDATITTRWLMMCLVRRDESAD
ncbi:class I SAM-dependent methyltransferase [Kribbella sp. DT2]|uniref:class I SAM-dependent methyltransferase n=1 Tax=Kribbella sp. DT2 TaxID=3393427 RepID=UPI003CF0692F